MTRVWHYLKPNHRSETIHSCIFFDCETVDDIQPDGRELKRLVFGWGAAVRRRDKDKWSDPVWARFTRGKQFWRWVDGRCLDRQCTYVWAHNQSFDFIASGGFDHLPKLGWKIIDAIIDSPPLIIRYRKGTRKLIVVDTLNIWRMSLAELGEKIGLAKGVMPDKWDNVSASDAYCRNDVDIIMRAVLGWSDWLRHNDMGGFCLTAASQAMRTFRHKYMQDRILIDCHPDALTLARAAYHGGRTECGYIGRVPKETALVDVNSMYPYVMRHNRYPLRLRSVRNDLDVRSLHEIMQEFCVIAHVRVGVTSPALPFKVNGKLVFPVGEYDTHVSTPECEYLIERNELLKVHTVAVYDHGRPFQQFVDDLYGQRLEAKRNGDVIESNHIKLLLNAFYGKWGQNGCKWETVGTSTERGIRFSLDVDGQTGEITRKREFAGLIQEKRLIAESRESHPAIAAHVTAYARLVLWALIRQVPAEDYYYCDTDSLLISRERLETFRDVLDEENLGSLKKVHEYKDVTIYGCKDYIVDGKQVTKGIRRDAQQLDHGRYVQTKWDSIRGMLRSNAINCPVSRRVIRNLRRSYDKGVVSSTGFVVPFHLFT